MAFVSNVIKVSLSVAHHDLNFKKRSWLLLVVTHFSLLFLFFHIPLSSRFTFYLFFFFFFFCYSNAIFKVLNFFFMHSDCYSYPQGSFSEVLFDFSAPFVIDSNMCDYILLFIFKRLSIQKL